MLRPAVSTGNRLKRLHDIRHFSKIGFFADRMPVSGPLDLFDPPKVLGKFIEGARINEVRLIEFIIHLSHPHGAEAQVYGLTTRLAFAGYRYGC